jgi:hypothetical protein
MGGHWREFKFLDSLLNYKEAKNEDKTGKGLKTSADFTAENAEAAGGKSRRDTVRTEPFDRLRALVCNTLKGRSTRLRPYALPAKIRGASSAAFSNQQPPTMPARSFAICGSCRRNHPPDQSNLLGYFGLFIGLVFVTESPASWLLHPNQAEPRASGN